MTKNQNQLYTNMKMGRNIETYVSILLPNPRSTQTCRWGRNIETYVSILLPNPRSNGSIVCFSDGLSFIWQKLLGKSASEIRFVFKHYIAPELLTEKLHVSQKNPQIMPNLDHAFPNESQNSNGFRPKYAKDGPLQKPILSKCFSV